MALAYLTALWFQWLFSRISSSFNGCWKCWKHRLKVRNVFQILSNCISSQITEISRPKMAIEWVPISLQFTEISRPKMAIEWVPISLQFTEISRPQMTIHWVTSWSSIHRQILDWSGAMSVFISWMNSLPKLRKFPPKCLEKKSQNCKDWKLSFGL